MSIPHNEEHAEAFQADQRRKHEAWLAQPMDKADWVHLLMRCQNGEATCMFVAEKIEHMLDLESRPKPTPDSSLPRLDPSAPTRPAVITVDLPANMEKRLDHQWVIEREIAADRWGWTWADEFKFTPKA